MSENISPNDRRFKSRGKIIAAIVAVVLSGVCAAVGVNAAMTGASEHKAGAPMVDLRPPATAEQASALTLPVLDSWLEEDFENSWIVVANTLEHVAHALDQAAEDPEQYANWVPRFEQVITLADAVSGGDQAGAKAAFDPLLAAEPGPYDDAVVDAAMSEDPYADAEAYLLELDAAIAAKDRGATRKAVANTAVSLSEVVLMTQLDLSADDAPEALERLLPAFHAIDDVQDVVLHGHASDAAAAATTLHTELAAFRSWQLSLAS
ncbi:hypothetical protein ACX80D_14320 [Arthrobacter sp. Sr24]